jgi:hypothetical protein
MNLKFMLLELQAVALIAEDKNTETDKKNSKNHSQLNLLFHHYASTSFAEERQDATINKLYILIYSYHIKGIIAACRLFFKAACSQNKKSRP